MFFAYFHVLPPHFFLCLQTLQLRVSSCVFLGTPIFLSTARFVVEYPAQFRHHVMIYPNAQTLFLLLLLVFLVFAALHPVVSETKLMYFFVCLTRI